MKKILIVDVPEGCENDKISALFWKDDDTTLSREVKEFKNYTLNPAVMGDTPA